MEYKKHNTNRPNRASRSYFKINCAISFDGNKSETKKKQLTKILHGCNEPFLLNLRVYIFDYYNFVQRVVSLNLKKQTVLFYNGNIYCVCRSNNY